MCYYLLLLLHPKTCTAPARQFEQFEINSVWNILGYSEDSWDRWEYSEDSVWSQFGISLKFSLNSAWQIRWKSVGRSARVAGVSAIN